MTQEGGGSTRNRTSDRESLDRIVSLAPSATATLQAMGAAEMVVGVTHHCEHETAERVGGWLNPNYEAVAALEPDLVLTADALQDDVRDELEDRDFDVFHRTPQSLDAVVDSFLDLGRAIGRTEDGRALAKESRKRLTAVREATADRDRPIVYCEEWSRPPMAAGNWVPEAVEAAGGRYPFVDSGERSREVTAETVEAAEPEHAFLHVCGHGDNVDPSTVSDRDWDVPAIENGNVHVLDDSVLNQPSPNLIRGIETIASVLHPIERAK